MGRPRERHYPKSFLAHIGKKHYLCIQKCYEDEKDSFYLLG